MDVTDRICDLECYREGRVHEFEGSVKIVLMEGAAKHDYAKKKSGAAFVAIANMMMGATVMLVLFLTLDFDLRPLFRPYYISMHIVLCTIGYQLCMPSAILMLHALNGASVPLKKPDRRRQHIYLQLFGTGCGLLGSILVYKYGEKWNVLQKMVPLFSKLDLFSSLHFYAGCATGGLAVMNILSGPLLYLRKREFAIPSILTSCHRLLGVLSFLTSSMCFIFGLLRPLFIIWLEDVPVALNFIIFFCVFYTIIVLFTPISKFSSASRTPK